MMPWAAPACRGRPFLMPGDRPSSPSTHHRRPHPRQWYCTSSYAPSCGSPGAGTVHHVRHRRFGTARGPAAVVAACHSGPKPFVIPHRPTMHVAPPRLGTSKRLTAPRWRNPVPSPSSARTAPPRPAPPPAPSSRTDRPRRPRSTSTGRAGGRPSRRPSGAGTRGARAGRRHWTGSDPPRGGCPRRRSGDIRDRAGSSITGSSETWDIEALLRAAPG